MKLVNKETDGRIYLYCFMINFDLNNKHQCAIIVHSFVTIEDLFNLPSLFCGKWMTWSFFCLLGSETDSRPEPTWRSLTQEKTRVHQSFSTKTSPQLAPPPNSTSLSTPQSCSTQAISKPSLQPKPLLPPTSKPQAVNQSSQQIPPKMAPRAMERWTMSSQREEQSSVSQSTHRDELLDFKVR